VSANRHPHSGIAAPQPFLPFCNRMTKPLDPRGNQMLIKFGIQPSKTPMLSANIKKPTIFCIYHNLLCCTFPSAILGLGFKNIAATAEGYGFPLLDVLSSFWRPKKTKTHPPERSGAAATSCFDKRYPSSTPLTTGDGFFLVLCILLRAYALSARFAKS